MTKRRDTLRAMLQPINAPALPAAGHDGPTARMPIKPGSLTSMGLSLQTLSDEAADARLLRQQLASAEQIVSLDPDSIVASPIRDRLASLSGEADPELMESIAVHGQQVPVLVRPVPGTSGRYQIAYGHRRVAALRKLGRTVRAIVRDLSDEELFIAQGKENLERQDLSFIERALFARRLEDHRVSRETLMAALSVHKGNLSTMLSIVRRLPDDLIEAIGPAPKAGRPRWEALAALVDTGPDRWRPLVETPGFKALSTDLRFATLLRRLAEPDKSTEPVVTDQSFSGPILGVDGTPIARAAMAGGRLRLSLDERDTPEFAAYLVQELPAIHAAFRRRQA